MATSTYQTFSKYFTTLTEKINNLPPDEQNSALLEASRTERRAKRNEYIRSELSDLAKQAKTGLEGQKAKEEFVKKIEEKRDELRKPHEELLGRIEKLNDEINSMVDKAVKAQKIKELNQIFIDNPTIADKLIEARAYTELAKKLNSDPSVDDLAKIYKDETQSIDVMEKKCSDFLIEEMRAIEAYILRISAKKLEAAASTESTRADDTSEQKEKVHSDRTGSSQKNDSVNAGYSPRGKKLIMAGGGLLGGSRPVRASGRAMVTAGRRGWNDVTNARGVGGKVSEGKKLPSRILNAGKNAAKNTSVTRYSKVAKVGNRFLGPIGAGLEGYNAFQEEKKEGRSDGQALTVGATTGAGVFGGACLGLQAGAAIGSVIPGAGTAVGGAIGFVAGAACAGAGAWLGGKAGHAIGDGLWSINYRKIGHGLAKVGKWFVS